MAVSVVAHYPDLSAETYDEVIASLDLDANLRIDDTAQLQARARVALDTNAITAHVDLDTFDLARLQPYVSAYTQISLLSGILKSGLDIERTADGALDIKGDTTLVAK